MQSICQKALLLPCFTANFLSQNWLLLASKEYSFLLHSSGGRSLTKHIHVMTGLSVHSGAVRRMHKKAPGKPGLSSCFSFFQ